MVQPFLSVIIPVYNEEEGLEKLFSRLIPVLRATENPFEIICVNDGSGDHSQKILESLYARYPENLRIVQFIRNYGQQFALLAGLQAMRGDIAITMDADLQNPPEDIPKLVAPIHQGHDLVIGYRSNRHDPFYRRFVSKLSNVIRNSVTNVSVRDHGCAFNAYHKDVVARVLAAADSNSCAISVTSRYFSANPTEIHTGHGKRVAGRSSYNLYTLLRVNFDLITGFSLVPLQIFTLLAILVALLSGLFAMYSVVGLIIFSANTSGVFVLLSVLVFLVSLAMVGIGLVGEYVGRIYKAVRCQPSYIVKETSLQPPQPDKPET